MYTLGLIRRVAIAACSAFALLAAVASRAHRLCLWGQSRTVLLGTTLAASAMIGGVQWPVRATARYYASAIDQASSRNPITDATQLVQALKYWLGRDL